MTNQSELIKKLASLDTERINPDTINIDHLSAEQIVAKINDEDKKVAEAVGKVSNQIAAVAEKFAFTLKQGGRIIYIGAGTSGRLGVLDAAECPPTFGTDPKQIIGLISGGYDTLLLSKEGVEDDEGAAVDDLKKINLSKKDYLIGLAASTRTPYTLAGLKYARTLGAATAFICCNQVNNEYYPADIVIPVIVGPEVITGSTRMKSGTAQKLVLNMISTTAMILIGKTYGNLMVDLQARSEKLTARSQMILIDLFSISYQEAELLLNRSGGSVKTAIVMKQFDCEKSDAENKLKEADGFIHKIRK